MPTELKERCALCRAAITCWGYRADEEFDPNDTRYQCSGVFCDIEKDSCLNHYCKKCFDKHTCKAHKG